MLDILTEGFSKAKERFTGKATLTPDNLREALDDVRNSLLEADVEYSVVKTFTDRVQKELEGETVQLSAGRGAQKVRVRPADHFVKACQTELEKLMGPVETGLNFPSNRPAVVMMVGLQGSGKTTTTGKLTRYLMEHKRRKPMLVAADIYRPAAVEQLRVLGERLGVPVFSIPGQSPVEISKQALLKAFEFGCDTILIDTAGRLTIDETLMQELVNIKAATNPDNILFVCDAMMGQDAVTTAKAFNEKLAFSGVIMTKLDGDARGGAALSIKEITGKPIKFLGMGEDLDKLEEFRPEGLASRILGMGDVVGLMQDFERVAEDDQEEQAMRMLKGQFSFLDFYNQISMIQKMGSLKDIAAKLPMQGLIPKDANVDDGELTRIKAMIDSMTKQERIGANQLNPSRVKRIALGSGRTTNEVNELVKKFSQMRKMMSMLGQNMGMLGKIPGLGNLAQLGNMRKMAQSMAGGGGMGDLMSMMGGGGGLGSSAGAPKKKFDRDKVKKMKKLAKKAKKKNRKK